jgi:hypothetical protein
MSSLYHCASIVGSSWTKQKFFAYMTSFDALPDDVIKADRGMTDTGEVVTFTLQSQQAQFGQRPFKVRTVRYDTNNLIAVAVTLDGHPLRGWRAWQVSAEDDGVLLETWSIDEPANSRERVKYALGGEAAQKETWEKMLENIAAKSGGTIEWKSDPLGERSASGDYERLWGRMAVAANGE